MDTQIIRECLEANLERAMEIADITHAEKVLAAWSEIEAFFEAQDTPNKNKTGYTGVYLHGETGKYYGVFQRRKVRHFTGYHTLPMNASIARTELITKVLENE